MRFVQYAVRFHAGSLWVAVSLGLAACGGGGGGDDGGAPAPGISQQAYVKASNSEGTLLGAHPDRFGGSVALSADGSTLVVGAIGEDSNATGIGGNQADNSAAASGAVYVFIRSGAIWTQQAYVKASNAGEQDTFGWSVALSADGNTLAVGAPGESSSATGIGGNQADNSAIRAGAVYVFTRSGATWTQQAYIKASNTGAEDEFGRAIALSADGNTLAVGAPGEDSNATGIGGNEADNSATMAGAVYVLTRSGATWTQQAYVKASNTGAVDQFGGAVALSGDGNTLAAGAPRESSRATGIGGNQADDSGLEAGAVYVFTRSGATWTQQAYIKASNTGWGSISGPPDFDSFPGDKFGGSLALSADGNTLAVGAIGEDSNATGIGGNQADDSAAASGAVYVFARSGATWTQQAYVKASNTGGYGPPSHVVQDDEGDNFGGSVALSSDGNTLMVGAPSESSNATGIGGNQADNSARKAGAAYVLTRSGATWTQQEYVKASNTGAQDRFGGSVALSADGSTLAVGATGESSNATGIDGNQADNSAASAGAVYVFR